MRAATNTNTEPGEIATGFRLPEVHEDLWMEFHGMSSHAIFVDVRGLLILIIPTRSYDVTKAKFFLVRILVAVDVTNKPKAYRCDLCCGRLA